MIELIPAIDIINGQCVRLTQGDYDAKTVYSTDPTEVAVGFERMGMKRLHVVDLDIKCQSVQSYRSVFSRRKS